MRHSGEKLLSAICLLALIFSCSSLNRLPEYVYYRLNTNPTTLDPALIVDVTGGSISAKLFNGLVKMDRDLGIAPDIASEYEISKNGLIYRFELKNGVLEETNFSILVHNYHYKNEPKMAYVFVLTQKGFSTFLNSMLKLEDEVEQKMINARQSSA